ncbi:MAG TPA: tRNA lysidine(34) synthetase TilS [Solirubrobacteraceae bacterium]|nr:tRNA lysidine(34) synthetase TilS [Solirubrobacteraceae bacterium]
MVERVREQVRCGGLLPADGRVVAMLSGGRDSVCLLDVVVSLCGAKKATALHVNYGLRPAAEQDETHCRALCEQLGVAIEILRAEREPDVGGNLHAWARELRYAAARELAERHDALIAVGHTATDQVETILYRLAASPGRRALLGMPACDGRLVRPLLALEREQTAAYCAERGLDWREDESNDRLEFARARVRHGLLPALEAVHPAARANVLRTAALLREEGELIDALVDAELGESASMEMARLAELPSALARQVAIRLAERAAGTLVPQAGERVGELVELWRRGGPAELHIGGLVAARVAAGRLSMRRIEPRPQRPRRSRRPTPSDGRGGDGGDGGQSRQ